MNGENNKDRSNFEAWARDHMRAAREKAAEITRASGLPPTEVYSVMRMLYEAEQGQTELVSDKFVNDWLNSQPPISPAESALRERIIQGAFKEVKDQRRPLKAPRGRGRIAQVAFAFLNTLQKPFKRNRR